MNEEWRKFLVAAGAEVANGAVCAIARRNGPEYALGGSFVCDLSGWSLLEFAGPDSESFLHGQLTSDVKALPHDRAQLAAYNTPRGRILATMLIWRSEDGFLAQLPDSVASAVLRRLSMFILRAKVSARDASAQYMRFGVGGPAAAEVLGSTAIPIPMVDFGVVRATAPQRSTAPSYVLRLPNDRFELVYDDPHAAAAGWEAVCQAGAIATGPAPWRWLAVRSGVADVVAETQDKFVPQMLNLELVGAVSFTKGCYPGQEIVARTQYRGEIKRRTFLAHIASESAPAPGDDVIAEGDLTQPVGSVATVAAAPGGGYDALVCLHVDLSQGATLRVRAPGGPSLALLDLPYDLPATA